MLKHNRGQHQLRGEGPPRNQYRETGQHWRSAREPGTLTEGRQTEKRRPRGGTAVERGTVAEPTGTRVQRQVGWSQRHHAASRRQPLPGRQVDGPEVLLTRIQREGPMVGGALGQILKGRCGDWTKANLLTSPWGCLMYSALPKTARGCAPRWRQ